MSWVMVDASQIVPVRRVAYHAVRAPTETRRLVLSGKFMTDSEAAPLSEIPEAGYRVVATIACPIEHLAGLGRRENLPLEAAAVLSQLNIVDAEFQQLARFADSLPGEAAALLAEGTAASSQLRVEFNSDKI
jgi:hypothetical protein